MGLECTRKSCCCEHSVQSYISYFHQSHELTHELIFECYNCSRALKISTSVNYPKKLPLFPGPLQQKNAIISPKWGVCRRQQASQLQANKELRSSRGWGTTTWTKLHALVDIDIRYQDNLKLISNVACSIRLAMLYSTSNYINKICMAT